MGTILRIIAATVLTILSVVACGGASTPFAPAPEPGIGVPGASAYSVSGTVKDFGSGALADAVITVVDGPDAGLFTTTSRDGGFALMSVRGLPNIRASKRGYTDQVRQLIAVDGTRAMVLFNLKWNFAGAYTLTFAASPECNRDRWDPNFVPSRSYRATIDGTSRIYLTGATFAAMPYGNAGGLQNSVGLHVSADRVTMFFEDPPVAELDASGRSLVIYGQTEEGMLTDPVTELRFVGEFAGCQSQSHQLTMRRTSP